MVGIHGIGGVPEPRPERPAEVRDRKIREEQSSQRAEDDVIISSEAQAAASLSQMIKEFKVTPDIRADKVAAARESLERGDYKNPEVVAKVAERISKYL